MVMSAGQITDEKKHGKQKPTYPARTKHITTRKAKAKRASKRGHKKL